MLFFSDANTCQHRLSRLHRLLLVGRFRLPARAAAELHPHRLVISSGGHLPSTEYGYVLDAVGAQVLAADRTDLGGEPRRVRWRTEQALAIATNPRLGHTLGVNQTFVELTAAARSMPGAGPVTWWGEAYCHAQFEGLVNPDGIGVWQQHDRRVLFALEYDRGTETLTRLAGKLDGYLLLETALGGPFWLLISVPGPRREAGARALLSRHGLAVATTSRTRSAGPAAAVWAPVPANRHGQRLRLIDLADWPRPAASHHRIAQARARSTPAAS